jgi:hypothetical protein
MTMMGRPVFGFWLPFLGWRDLPADREGLPCFEDPATGRYVRKPYAIGSFLQFEWLGIGVVFAGSNYRPVA